MIRDTINKEFRCPICNISELLYIDLNEIKKDSRASTGIVIRVFSHKDHSIQLDIDLNGDIRAINPIKKDNNMGVTNSKWYSSVKIRDYFIDFETILVISSNPIFKEFIHNDLRAQINQKFDFNLVKTKDKINLNYLGKKMEWLFSTNGIPSGTYYDLMIIDQSTDNIENLLTQNNLKCSILVNIHDITQPSYESEKYIKFKKSISMNTEENLLNLFAKLN